MYYGVQFGRTSRNSAGLIHLLSRLPRPGDNVADLTHAARICSADARAGRAAVAVRIEAVRGIAEQFAFIWIGRGIGPAIFGRHLAIQRGEPGVAAYGDLAACPSPG